MRRPGPRLPDGHAGAPGFVRALQAARVAAHLTQQELAAAAGLPRSLVQRLETGRVPIRPGAFVALAAALGLQITLAPLPGQPAAEPVPTKEESDA